MICPNCKNKMNKARLLGIFYYYWVCMKCFTKIPVEKFTNVNINTTSLNKRISESL